MRLLIIVLLFSKATLSNDTIPTTIPINAHFINAGSILAATTALSEAEVMPTSIDLDWRSVPGAQIYILQRATSISFSDAVEVYNGPVSAYTDTGLSIGATYYYRVKPHASGFEDGAWVVDNATTSSSSFDPDAQRYLDSAGIGAGIFSDATHALFFGLKDKGLWNLYSFIHLYGGGSYESAKWNARYPYNDTLAYKLLEIGIGIAYDAQGATLNGTNAFNTKFIPAAAGLDNTTGAHISFYSGTSAVVNQYIMGMLGLFIAPNPDGAASYIRVGATFSSGVKQNSQGVHLANRIPNDDHQRYKHDDVLIINSLLPFNKYQDVAGNNEVYVGALNDVTDLFFTGNIRFDTGGKGMTPQQETDHYNLFHAWVLAVSQ